MSRRTMAVFGALLVLVAAGACRVITAAPKTVDWHYDYANAVRYAQEARKPLLVDFYTPWCGWCKKLDQTTYIDADVVSLSREFVCVKVDGDKHKDLVEKFKIDGYPQIIFLDSNSREIGRLSGYREKEQLLQDIHDVLNSSR